MLEDYSSTYRLLAGDEPGDIDCLTCTPDCPICFSRLRSRAMPGVGEQHWYCPECKTEWEVVDLVAAINYEEVE